MPGRQFPIPRVPRARLSAYRDQRAEGLSRRRRRLALSLRRVGQARLLRQGRRPPPSCRPRRRRAWARTAQFLRARGGDEPDPEINAKFAHKLAFVDEMADWGAARAAGGGARDPGRRPQHRAARARRLEPQGAAQRGQPHADRGRQTEPRPGGRAVGRRAAQIRARRSEALHMVELSLARLVQGEQGAAPRPHLGEPGARRRRQVDARPARRPRLGAPFRPRSGDGGIGDFRAPQAPAFRKPLAVDSVVSCRKTGYKAELCVRRA